MRISKHGELAIILKRVPGNNTNRWSHFKLPLMATGSDRLESFLKRNLYLSNLIEFGSLVALAYHFEWLLHLE